MPKREPQESERSPRQSKDDVKTNHDSQTSNNGTETAAELPNINERRVTTEFLTD